VRVCECLRSRDYTLVDTRGSAILSGVLDPRRIHFTNGALRGGQRSLTNEEDGERGMRLIGASTVMGGESMGDKESKSPWGLPHGCEDCRRNGGLG